MSKYGIFTRPGRCGSNQDTLVRHIPGDPDLMARKGALFIVADGMRGKPAGKVASSLAAQTVLQAYYANRSPDPVQSLRAAVGTADGWLRYWSAVRADLRGMGTTLTAVVVLGRELILAHVGDSRAYLVRGGRAWQLTRDHTWATDALSRGLLTPQEAAGHPWRHVLTRSLDGSSAAVDVRRVNYAPGDRLVLCSDGVSDLLAAHEVAWLAMRSPRRAAKAMVQMARRRGGGDDASTIVVPLDRPPRQPQQAMRAPHVAAQSRQRAAAGGAALRTPAQQAFLLACSLGAVGVMILLGMVLAAGG